MVENISSRLHTNYGATEQEIQQIHAFLDQLSPEMQALQEKANASHARYLALQEKYAALQQKVKENNALIAPIRRLPVFVIQEIFLRCLPRSNGAPIDVKECPILLTHVCSLWRAIALQTPLLWSSIHISIPVYNHYYRSHSWQTLRNEEIVARAMQRRLEAVAEWLRRSGSSTLDITIFMQNFNTSLGNDQLQQVLDLIVPISHRWGAIHLHMDDIKAGLSRIQALGESDVPRLHTVSLPAQSANFSELDWTVCGLLRAQYLRSVAIYGARQVDELNSVSSRAFSGLTSLYLHDVNWSSFRNLARLLIKCPLLEQLAFDMKYIQRQAPSMHDAGAHSVPASIPLLHLSDLSVTITGTSSDVSGLLEALEMPTLIAAKIIASEAAAMLPFLRRIIPSLNILALDPTYLTRAQFIECVCSGGELRTIILTADGLRKPRLLQDDQSLHLDDDFLSLFILGGEDRSLAPYLSSFRCALPTDFSDEQIRSFVESRRGRLKSVHIQRVSKEDSLVNTNCPDSLAFEEVDIQFTYTTSRAPRVREYAFPVREGIPHPTDITS